MGRNHKQRILIVHNYYQIPGGEDTVVANEKRLLEEHGHEVVLYTRHNNELKSMNKLQKLALPLTTIFNSRTYRDIKRIIKEEKIEIVHVHNTLNLISPAVYYAAVKMKVPVVQTVHNFRFLCPGATFYRDGHICEDCVTKGLKCSVKHKCYRGSRAQTLICAISTWIHRHTGILRKINYIALTEFNKEKLLQLKQIKQEQVFVKPNFTFKEVLSNTVESRERKFYLYIGRIEEIKGIRMLIQAFTRMPSRELRLAGQGPLMEEFTTSDNIVFLGQVEHKKLIDLISHAKAIVLPSQIYEGFPMVIPEAFSQSTPMIVGNIGNIGALVDDMVTGIKFKYDSCTELISAIQRYEQNDMDKIGASCRKKFDEEYTSNKNYKMFEDIYNTICRQ